MPATTFGFAHEQALRGRRIPLLAVDEDIGNTAGQRGPHCAYRRYPARLRFWRSFDRARDLLFDHDFVHRMPGPAPTGSANMPLLVPASRSPLEACRNTNTSRP